MRIILRKLRRGGGSVGDRAAPQHQQVQQQLRRAPQDTKAPTGATQGSHLPATSAAQRRLSCPSATAARSSGPRSCCRRSKRVREIQAVWEEARQLHFHLCRRPHLRVVTVSTKLAPRAPQDVRGAEQRRCRGCFRAAGAACAYAPYTTATTTAAYATLADGCSPEAVAALAPLPRAPPRTGQAQRGYSQRRAAQGSRHWPPKPRPPSPEGPLHCTYPKQEASELQLLAQGDSLQDFVASRHALLLPLLGGALARALQREGHQPGAREDGRLPAQGRGHCALPVGVACILYL